MLLFAIDKEKVAVDVEKIVERDEALLEDVILLNEKIPLNPLFRKGEIRENFYLQRCGKECLVKYLNLTSKEMEKMHVISIKEKKSDF